MTWDSDTIIGTHLKSIRNHFRTRFFHADDELRGGGELIIWNSQTTNLSSALTFMKTNTSGLPGPSRSLIPHTTRRQRQRRKETKTTVVPRLKVERDVASRFIEVMYSPNTSNPLALLYYFMTNDMWALMVDSKYNNVTQRWEAGMTLGRKSGPFLTWWITHSRHILFLSKRYVLMKEVKFGWNDEPLFFYLLWS